MELSSIYTVIISWNANKPVKQEKCAETENSITPSAFAGRANFGSEDFDGRTTSNHNQPCNYPFRAAPVRVRLI